MASLVSACGIECDTCPFFKKSCSGCYEMGGRPFWVHEHLEGHACPIYDCGVNERALAGCARCPDLPCKKFEDLKDPSTSDEVHLEGIAKRVKLLRETLS
jgi:hypothetical protein